MPTTSVASAREILTGLHEVMASRTGAQAKLNKVVKIIAEAMASEVCSIYLLRDGVLELFATVGPSGDSPAKRKPRPKQPGSFNASMWREVFQPLPPVPPQPSPTSQSQKPRVGFVCLLINTP